RPAAIASRRHERAGLGRQSAATGAAGFPVPVAAAVAAVRPAAARETADRRRGRARAGRTHRHRRAGERSRRRAAVAPPRAAAVDRGTAGAAGRAGTAIDGEVKPDAHVPPSEVEAALPAGSVRHVRILPQVQVLWQRWRQWIDARWDTVAR